MKETEEIQKQNQNQDNFWDGVTDKDGNKLTDNEKLNFVDKFLDYVYSSDEFAKIFGNTQVYNDIVNNVTTRGAHSQGVAVVAAEIAKKKAEVEYPNNINMVKASSKLAQVLGYMHDLGHTPYGHDGEGALGDEMSRFSSTEEYLLSRSTLFGKEYATNTISKEMCYEHNETSAIIASKLVKQFMGNEYVIDEQSLQYIKTGILAHSTSRVKDEPIGLEQQSVRLADKIAYIPQDLLDLIKQGVVSIDNLTISEKSLIGLGDDTAKTQEMLEDIRKYQQALVEKKEGKDSSKIISDEKIDLLLGKLDFNGLNCTT